MHGAGPRILPPFIDPDQIQRNVWHCRRRRAGQLSQSSSVDEREGFWFTDETVARADRAFLEHFRRLPEAHDWTTRYLLLLQQIERESGEHQILTPDTATACVVPLLSPGTARLRRTVRSRNSSSMQLPLMLASLILMGLFLVYFAATADNTPALPLVVMMAVCFVGFAIAMPMIRNATEVVYMCPECGHEYETARRIEQCERCYLEFAKDELPWGEMRPRTVDRLHDAGAIRRDSRRGLLPTGDASGQNLQTESNWSRKRSSLMRPR